MQIFIPFLIVGIFSSIFSGLFLSFYYQLVRTANKTTGNIISFDRSNFIILWEILMPVVRFETQNNSIVEGQPEYSFFNELNGFVRHGDVIVYYQADNPEKFVIESVTEVLANWLIIAFTLISIMWLFIR